MSSALPAHPTATTMLASTATINKDVYEQKDN
jgi:hypothetical protein